MGEARSSQRLTGSIGALLLAVLACGGEKAEEKPAAPPPGPPLGVLELPVSLRSGDAAPSDSRKVEVTPGDIRVDGQVVLTLENGRVPAAERQGDVVPKLKAALGNPARPALSLGLHSSLPYETAAAVLSTASSAGMRKVAFQVRKPGGSPVAAWLVPTSFQVVPRSYDAVAITDVDPRKWDDFGAAWQAIYDACRTSQTGSCAYVPGSVAKGGELKLVLHASGQGVNVNFFRVGLTDEQLAAEEQARQAELAAKKEDVVQGRGEPSELEEQLLEGPPASEAMFQFRAREALEAPSALTAAMQPLCGPRACGAVVTADDNTLAVRVVSLIGAAFADGAAPSLAFELPWTPKPKPKVLPQPAAPPVALPEAPAKKKAAKKPARKKK
jgi:hypothetical protein